MLAACELAGLKYIVNVVIDGEKEDGRRVCRQSDHSTPLVRAATLSRTTAASSPNRRAISSSHPTADTRLTRTFTRVSRGLTAAEAAATDNGTLIISSAWGHGSGGEGFFRALSECESPQKPQEEILKVPMDQTKPDQWEYQILSRILWNHRVIFVSDPAQKEMIEAMKPEYALDLETALKTASEGLTDPHIVVIPDGVSVIVEA